MAMDSKVNNKCVLIVLIVSLLSAIVSASSREPSQQERLPIAREKRTINVIARGLANIFGLENGQTPTGSTNPTTSNPLILTYPPIQRVTTEPYQPLTYPRVRTTTPAPAPITYPPLVTAPPPTTKAPPPPTKAPPPPPPTKTPAPKQKGQLSSPNPLIGVPTTRPVILTPKRLITLRPAPLSPTRIITSKPLSISTYSQTERTQTQSGRLDAKKEVVLIGIPVTIHKLGGFNLGLFSGGNDAGQLQEFQNIYNKQKAKDIESVHQTNKVKENSYKSVADFDSPHGVKNVGLVDDYDEYSKRISNKIKTQGTSEESNGNTYDSTTLSPPYKYDEFDIPDVASQDAGNHQDNEDYSDKENERETWKFYREESKNARPPVQPQQVFRDTETQGKRPSKEKEEDSDDYEEKRGGVHDDVDYERYKDLTIMKVDGRNKEPKQKYRDPDGKRNPSYEEHTEFEHHSYDDDNPDQENENQQPDRGSKEENKERGNGSHHHEGTRNEGHRDNPKDRDSYYQRHRESDRESTEDNIEKHRHHDDERESENGRNRGHADEGNGGQDTRNQYKTSNGEKRPRNEWRGQKLNEGSGGRDGDEGHGEFDYGHYRDDWDPKQGDDFNHKHRPNNEHTPDKNQENFGETHGNDRGRDDRQKNREIIPKSRKPNRNQEKAKKPQEERGHEDDGGHGYRERGSRDRQKTPKDEKRNENPRKQQEGNGGDGRHEDHISWDYGNSGDGQNSKESGYTDDKPHHVGWENQENPALNSGTHSHEKQGPYNYEPNSWDVHHNPGQGNHQNGSSPHPEHPVKPVPEHGSGQHHGSEQEVFDYDQYTKNHGVHGFRFPGPYDNINSSPDNFWGPPQSVSHEKYVHHGVAPAYQPQVYSYDAPGYFGPFKHPGHEQQGHSFEPHHNFNPHAVLPTVTVPTRPEAKGPQRRTEFKTDKAKTEVDELASDSLSSDMQREVPARGSRPKKSDTGRKASGQVRKEVRKSAPERKILPSPSLVKSISSNSYPSPSRPRPVLQAIQQIEGNRQPQLWPSPYDASFDSSRRVTVSTPSNSKNPRQPSISKAKSQGYNLPKLNGASQDPISREKNQIKSKFEPFKTKPNEKVELKFGWPKSFLTKDLQTQRGRGPKPTPTYTKNSKTSYQADAELYDFGKFNKKTGHYEVQGSARNFRSR